MAKGKDTKHTIIKDKPKKKGRPTLYTADIAVRICRMVGSSSLSLKKICASSDDFPCPDTVNQWRYDHPEFSAMYMEAKRIQADLLADEIIEISDDDSLDVVEGQYGPMYLTGKVARDRLRVDSRKWVACKLIPKVYGDKAQEVVTPASSQEVKEIADAINKLNAKHEREY